MQGHSLFSLFPVPLLHASSMGPGVVLSYTPDSLFRVGQVAYLLTYARWRILLESEDSWRSLSSFGGINITSSEDCLGVIRDPKLDNGQRQ
jgi:hypothetical protein